MGQQEGQSSDNEERESQAMSELARKAREAMDRMGIDSGVYLSWRDLSLQETQKVKDKPTTLINNFLSTVQFWRRAQKEDVTLLNKVSGYVKPHMMVLLLGPPSAGKTTLLETLAGKKDRKSVSGEVLMNGEPITPTFQRLFGYVTQEDILEPQLTVEETLQFSSTLRNHPDVSEEQKKARVKGTMEILSIAHVKDTNVGGEMLRGVSGGEKKRVSIGVEFVKGPLVFLLDEPTTGLDSTSALQVVRALRALADAGIPVICSLLQPSQELYELFDTVILMQNRSVAYFGPTARVLSHFEQLGFECPEDKNIAEFLLEICTEEGQEYRGEERGSKPPDLARDFRDSAANEELGKKLWKSVAPPSGVVTFKPSPYEPYGSSIWTQMKECTKEAGKCLIRNKRIFYSRIFRAVAIGLLLGTLFFRMDNDQSGAENRISLLFYCITFTAMGAIASIPQIVEERELYYHHRSLRFYRPFAYFFASICVDIPLSVIETVLFTTIVYWMTGLLATEYGAHFFLFVGILFLTNMLSKQFCRATAASVPSLNLATAIAPALLCIWLVFAGFLLPRNDIPNYWIWMNYIAPFRYTFEALAINEMYDHQFCETIARDCWITEGSQMLERFALYTDFYWVYIDTAILGAFYLIFCAVTFFSLSKLHWRTEVVAQKVGGAEKSEEGSETTSLIDHDHHRSQGLINDSGSAVDQPATLQDAQGAHLAFVNLSYSVPLDPRPLKRLCGHVEHKKLLNSVCGYVEPGQMVALMGASGAGKSTLLDVLAGRKTGGKITGKILINGLPKDEYFPRITGYVEQFNVFIPTLTVQETVRYNAAMRLPSDLSSGQRESRVEEAMRMVRIYHLRHHVVGEADSGLSPQQRKRLSIAVELVSSPSLLFLDEPTSGLDSQAAMEIMQMVRKISSSGIPVICTIHQPSAALFELFDRLLLLCKGGKLCYFGDREHSLDYFSQYGMVCEGRTNPADFVLECSMGVRSGKYAEPDEPADETPIDEESGEFQPYDAWSRSEESNQLKEYLDNVKEKSTHSREQAPQYDSAYAVGYFRQITQCLKRSFKAKYRQQRSNQSYLMIYFVMGIVLGSLYWQLDYSLSGTRNRVSLMYFVIVFSALGAIASIPNLIQQRAVYYREKPAFLRPLAYWIGCAITEIPIVIIGTGVFGALLYAMAGLNWTENGTHFFVFLGAYVTTSLTSTSFAMMIASIAPSTEVANSLVGMSLSIFSLFAGFIIPKNSIPGYWIWIHYISFFKYALEILSINELVGEEFQCATELQIPIPGTNQTLGVCPTVNGTEFLQNNFDMMQNDWPYWQTLGVDYGVLCGFTLLFTFAMYLGIRFVNHLKR